MNKQRTWLEISQENLIHNIKQFRKRVGDKVKIAGVIKSNAYGHGLIEVAQCIQSEVDWLAVDSVSEALQINQLKLNQRIVLVLGYTLLERLEEVVENGFHQVVTNLETLEKLNEIVNLKNKKAFIHLKIETGTSRQGIWQENLDEYLEIILQNNNLVLAGVSTHFANIEDTTDYSFAAEQLEKFQLAVDYIEKKGFADFLKHTACSAAAIIFPETHFDMIRLGISMYGLWSSSETKVSAKQKGIMIDLKPVLTWKTKIAHIKELSAGSTVSYGRTEKINVKTKVAILPIGYWDGYDRGLSSLGLVLINGQKCRVLGRVCMNMCVIDINHLENVKLENEVVLLGEQMGERITAEELAQKINTINYEVVTRINPKIKRVIN